MVQKVLRILKYVALGLVVGTALIFLLGFVVMWLWNWLMPDIFGLPPITYWQAWGLLLLAHLLLGGGQHEARYEHHGDGGFRRRVREKLGPPEAEGEQTAPASG